MTIEPTVTLQEIRGGFAARNAEIGLAGHGPDEERAVAVLRGAVETWARCLAREGILESTLRDRQVRYHDGGERIVVALRPIAVS